MADDDDLYPAEQQAIAAALAGRVLDLSSTEHQTIRGDRLVALATGTLAGQVHHHGVQIVGARVVGGIDFSHARVADPFELIGCEIEGNVSLWHAQFPQLLFTDSSVTCISGGGLRVDGNLYLNRKFSCSGEVNLDHADIQGDILCSGGTFRPSSKDALHIDYATVRGTVYLNEGFEASGEVRLAGSTIDKDLVCSGGRFMAPHRALSVKGATIKGSAFLDEQFQAVGEVDLVGATIAKDVRCRHGWFCASSHRCLSVDHAHVGGSVKLDDAFMNAEVGFVRAEITGDFVCSRSWFGEGGSKALDMNRATVSGGAYLDQASFIKGVSLVGTRVGVLLDKGTNWPDSGLELEDFTYTSFHRYADNDVNTRLEWVGRQDGFAAQPYLQLARVHREAGRAEWARTTLIKMEEKRQKARDLPTWRNVVNWILRVTVAHGYKPGRAVGVLIGIWAISAGLLSLWFVQRDMVTTQADTQVPAPHCPDNYPCFNAFVYSAETVIPLVNLHQDEFWQPRGSHNTARIIKWTGTVLGWILTTLVVAGLTGFVRRE